MSTSTQQQHDTDTSQHEHEDSAIQSLVHYIHCFNQQDLNGVLNHLHETCTVKIRQADGTVKQIAGNKDECKPEYERDFIHPYTVTVQSVHLDTTSNAANDEIPIRAMLHTTQGNGKWCDVTYYMRASDLLMSKHMIYGYGDINTRK